MIKRAFIIFIFFCVVFLTSLFPVEKVIFNHAIDLSKKLIQNNVFLKMCGDFDFDDQYIFLLDRRFSIIFQVDINSGKLIRTISSRGQGPGELSFPLAIKVKKEKIFVVDRGFSGVKIFDIKGTLFNEFKSTTSFRISSIDVNDHDEIFLDEIDNRKNTLVSVYDLRGNRIKSLINHQVLQKKKKSYLEESQYQIKLDKQRNIYLLFFLQRKLAKYSITGELLWEKKIKNQILDEFPKDDSLELTEETVSITRRIFDFDVTERFNIVIGHAGGGCVYNSGGELIKLIGLEKENQQKGLFLFKIKRDKLINITRFGEIIYIYKTKEV